MNKSFPGILSDYVLVHVKGEAGQSGATLRSYYTAIDQYVGWYTQMYQASPEAMDAASFGKEDVRTFLNYLENDQGDPPAPATCGGQGLYLSLNSQDR